MFSSRTSIMARNKKLKLILPAQLLGTTKKQSNILAAIDILKDELDLSGSESSDSKSEDCKDDSKSSNGQEHEEGKKKR
jgi:hypothetical protein